MSEQSFSPLVSVILPTRNRANLLKRAVMSVLAQTHEQLELIVVNDASTDHTAEVLACIKDPRLRIIHRQRNAGAAAARNAGIAVASGKWVAFQDDDDIWFPHKLERQVAALTNAAPGVAWCLCGFIRRESRSSYYVGGSWYYNQLDFQQGISRTSQEGNDWSLIATPCWLIEREVLLRVNAFDERIRSWDDWELGLRLDKVCQRVFIDEPLLMQDVADGGGLTRAERARANDLRIILEKHGKMWADSPRVMARHYFIIGRVESIHDGGRAGRDSLLKSLRLNPFSLKTWGALMLSIVGDHLNRLLTDRIRSVKSRF